MAFELNNFNSNEYAWKELKIVLAGRPITGCRGIKWKTTRTITPVYASGSKPHTITSGNKMYEGSVKLLQSELEALIESFQLKYGNQADVTDGPFDITCSFMASPTDRIKTHTIVGVRITEFEMGMEQDDPNMEIDLPFKAIDIKYNQ